jgi:hypothetical protein
MARKPLFHKVVCRRGPMKSRERIRRRRPSQGGSGGSNPLGATHLRPPNFGGCSPLPGRPQFGVIRPGTQWVHKRTSRGRGWRPRARSKQGRRATSGAFAAANAYDCVACCGELQEVSPRPGRTTVALGLRASRIAQTLRTSVTTVSMRRRQSSPLAQHHAIASGKASSCSVAAVRCS